MKKRISSNWPKNIVSGRYNEARLLGLTCQKCGDPNFRRFMVRGGFGEILICRDCLKELAS